MDSIEKGLLIADERYGVFKTEFIKCYLCEHCVENPMTHTPGCGVVVCLKCLEAIKRDECPNCQGTFTFENCVVLQQLLSSCIIKCRFNGCTKVITASARTVHEQDCQYNPNFKTHNCSLCKKSGLTKLELERNHAQCQRTIERNELIAGIIQNVKEAAEFDEKRLPLFKNMTSRLEKNYRSAQSINQKLDNETVMLRPSAKKLNDRDVVLKNLVRSKFHINSDQELERLVVDVGLRAVTTDENHTLQDAATLAQAEPMDVKQE